jgi:4-hydroxy-tetrahydrodipicolinate reductase
MTIKPGIASGVQQIGRGFVGDEEKITLIFRASVGEPESVDRIEINGIPDICSEAPGGINGDIATCAITINAIMQILKAQPGLRTMTDIPVVSFFS